MGSPNHEPMSTQAFLAWSATQAERYELVDGRVVRLMAGAKQGHTVVASNILVALAPQAKTRKCRTTASDTAVSTGPNSVRYPDVVVDCGPPDASATEASRPTVVVEISSPGTSTIDVTDKLDEYRAHDVIQAILFVDPDIVSAKLYRRDRDGSWIIEKYDALEQTIALPEIGAALALTDIYDSLNPSARPALRVVLGNAR